MAAYAWNAFLKPLADDSPVGGVAYFRSDAAPVMPGRLFHLSKDRFLVAQIRRLTVADSRQYFRFGFARMLSAAT
jgi:hypothetical protein